MTGRLNLVSDPGLTNTSGAVEERLQDWISGLDPEGYSELIDPLVRRVLHGAFEWVGGGEGTVWVADADEESLVAVYNSGPHAADLVGFHQPLDRGIISLVYANEQGYCENEIASREAHDDTLDRKIGESTGAMIAVPFYFAFALRGVISCVQMKQGDGDEPAGFDSRHVEEISAAASVAERMINGRLLTVLLGLDHA